ncbi:MAG TPA: hypothetical protein VKU00_30305 [Chthonomonadaceae bacterium]|nr:hypothetical protein [Chthonomonadaceae bacterium]
MKSIEKTWTCALLLALTLSPAWSLAGDHPQPYHQLTWKDFRINDDAPAAQDTAACTASRLAYQYRMRWWGRRGAYIATVSQIRILSEFDPARSWRRSYLGDDPDRILQHEQGHLDINEIYANRLRQIPLSAWPAGRGATAQEAVNDLERKIKTYFDQTLAQEHRDQEIYDRQTDHSRRAEQQEIWTQHIQKLLHQALTARR